MRCLVRAILPAAVILLAGCSLFRDSDIQVAKITSTTAPDTVRRGTTFNVMFHAFFAVDYRRLFDHAQVTYSDASLDVRVWSRPWDGGLAVPLAVSERDLTFEARALEPGEFRITAHQPDGKDTVKTITVLP